VEFELEFKITTPVALMLGFLTGLVVGAALAADGLGEAMDRLRGVGDRAVRRLRLPA
jgi:hypothetical protein